MTVKQNTTMLDAMALFALLPGNQAVTATAKAPVVTSSAAVVSAAPASVVKPQTTLTKTVASPASLTAHVYLDANANGTQNINDINLAGITVSLLNGDGTATGKTAVTDANGNVSFTGLTAGLYQVSVAAPAGDRVMQHTGILTPLTLTAGGTTNAIEGLYAPATFTAHVYTDSNADGMQGSGDTNLAGVKVTLLNGNGTATGQWAVTDANGNVTFSGLLPGSYQVSVAAQAGKTISQQSNILKSTMLASGATATAAEGLYALAAFGAHVYVDANGNGRQDGAETGRAGVTVALLQGNGAATGRTAVTDGNGNVAFAGLRPGSYEVAIATPTGDMTSQFDSVMTPLALTSGGSVNAVEGIYVPGTITAHVYTDANANGAQDHGDTSLGGVMVSLLNAGGSAIGKPVTADANGNVSFTGLTPGTYQVSIAPPAGVTVMQQTNVLTPITLASGGLAAAIEGFVTKPPAVAVAAAPVQPVAGANADVGLVAVGAPVYAAGSRLLTVGLGKQFQTISSAIAASRDGDVILVDSGTYTNDFAVITAKISLIAVGGRVTMNATVPPPNFKGILTEETDLTVVGFDFTNCRIPDAEGHNGAGIRVDNGNLVLRNDSFVGNQDGLLTNGGTSISVTIDHCLFNDNGGADGNGAGNIHNAYIGSVAFATVTNSIFENAQVGHEFKSRAVANTLTNNVFISGVGIGTGSYDIDLPNGGTDILTNNTIIKGPNSENPNMVHFGGEGIPYAGSSLSIQGNLFQSTNASAVGLLNQTAITATLSGNVLDGLPYASFVKGPATTTNNWDASGVLLQDQQLVGVLPGSTLIITDAQAHNVIMQGNTILAVQGGAGLLTLTVNDGHIIAIGGAGGMNVTENVVTGGNQYTTAAGSTNSLNLAGAGMDSIDSEGTDAIIAGNGNQVAVLNGNATVTGGSGNSQWSVNGTAAINTGSGSAFMTLGAAARLAITGTNTFFELDTNGGSATWNTMNAGTLVAGSLAGGAITMQVYTGVARITTSAGGAGAVLHLDQGDASITSAGADTIYAGAGTDTVIVSGAVQIYAASGSLSVFGRGDPGGADIFGAGGDTIIDGDTGNLTYHGGDQTNTVEARLSNIRLLGGKGLMTVNGGTRDTITGGAGGLVLNDFGGGANTITTMAGATNRLNVSNSNQINSYGTDTIVHSDGNTTIAIYGNSSLTLGGGNNQISLAGHDTVNVAAGYDVFTVGNGAQVSLTVANLNVIHETGAAVDVAFTDPNASGPAVTTVSVHGGTADISTTPGSGVSVKTTGPGPVGITASGTASLTSNGADSIHLGSGSANVVLQGSGAEIWAGSGNLTLNDNDVLGGNFILHGGSGSVVVGQYPSTMTYIGDAGTASLSGGRMYITAGSGALTVSNAQILSFQGGSGSANLSLNALGSRINFGSGNTLVQGAGWGQANAFGFLGGQGGTDIISHFVLGTDKIVLGTGVSVLSQSIVSGSATFSLSNGSVVTLVGITSTQGVFQ